MKTDTIKRAEGPCPLCSQPIPPRHSFFCPKCWWTVPAKDRQALGALQRRGQPTAAKVESVVRKMTKYERT